MGPNHTRAERATEYKYWFDNSAPSICNTWYWGENPPTEDISCATWKGCQNNEPDQCPIGDVVCSQKRYLTWWLQRIPGNGNDSRDRHGETRSNWWDFVTDI